MVDPLENVNKFLVWLLAFCKMVQEKHDITNPKFEAVTQAEANSFLNKARISNPVKNLMSKQACEKLANRKPSHEAFWWHFIVTYDPWKATEAIISEVNY